MFSFISHFYCRALPSIYNTFVRCIFFVLYGFFLNVPERCRRPSSSQWMSQAVLSGCLMFFPQAPEVAATCPCCFIETTHFQYPISQTACPHFFMCYLVVEAQKSNVFRPVQFLFFTLSLSFVAGHHLRGDHTAPSPARSPPPPASLPSARMEIGFQGQALCSWRNWKGFQLRFLVLVSIQDTVPSTCAECQMPRLISVAAANKKDCQDVGDQKFTDNRPSLNLCTLHKDGWIGGNAIRSQQFCGCATNRCLSCCRSRQKKHSIQSKFRFGSE